MFSQNGSDVQTPKLEVQLCDIFKCAEKNCFSSEVEKYVKAYCCVKDKKGKNEKQEPCAGMFCKEIPGNHPTLRVLLCDFKNSNKCNSGWESSNEIKISSDSEKNSDVDDYSEWDNSSEIESIHEDDDDYTPPKKETRKKVIKKKSLMKKVDSESESSITFETDSDSESSSKTKTDSDSESSSKTKKKSKKKYKKEKKRKQFSEETDSDLESSSKTKKNRKLTEYEKSIQKSRDEKMAFLKSLQIDKIKEEIKAESNLKKKEKRIMTNWKKVAPSRKSTRTLTLKKANLSEEFITSRAYSEASREQEELEAKKRKCKPRKDGMKTRSNREIDSEEDINVKSNLPSIIEDFLIPSLNDERYRHFLKWINRYTYSFSIHWLLTDNTMFEDYDKLKNRYQPEVKGYRRESIKRFYSTLNKISFVKRLPSKSISKAKYQIDTSKMKKDSVEHLRKLIAEGLKCSVCGKIFGQKHLLVHHFKIHTGEIPGSLNPTVTKDTLTILKKTDTVPLGLLPETSVQSIAKITNKVIILLKPPNNAKNKTEFINMQQPPKPEPNPTSSTNTNITSTCSVPQATTCTGLESMNQNSATLVDPPSITLD